MQCLMGWWERQPDDLSCEKKVQVSQVFSAKAKLLIDDKYGSIAIR